MMRAILSRGSLIAVAASVVLLPTAAARAALMPSDVWTFNWETYVDLQPGNSNVLSTNWDFTTNKWEEVYVDGDGVDNVGDEDEHQGEAAEGWGDNPLGLNELTMTLTGLTPNVAYSIDAVVMSEGGNDSDEWGISAGFMSLFGDAYNCVNRVAAHVDTSLNDEWLARIPLGTTTSDNNGQITVYFSENSGLDWSADSKGGAVVDGLIYSKQADIATPPSRLIVSADRQSGATDDDLPVGIHDGGTDPLASDDYGLRLGARTFSDRVFCVDGMSEGLISADYVRTFLNDKADLEGDFSYNVTLSTDLDEVYLMVLLDDRFELGGGEQQTIVDTVVAAFANPGDFADTGCDIDLSDSGTSHPLSAFGMTVPTKDQYGVAITYTFGATPSGAIATYLIAALEEMPLPPVTIPGDTNNDRIVDATDAAALAAHWGEQVTKGNVTKGDFNRDGYVNAADASILAANWGSHVASEATSVPEPTALALLLGAALPLVFRRRR